MKVPGAPSIYGFGADSALKAALRAAGLVRLEVRRLSGVFPFASAQAYWETVTAGGGRMRAMLASVAPAARSAIRRDVLAAAERRRAGGAVLIPYEFVLARGLRPGKPRGRG